MDAWKPCIDISVYALLHVSIPCALFFAFILLINYYDDDDDYDDHTTQIQNFKFDLFNLVTLDNLDLTQGHKRLRRVLRSVPDTIHAVLFALFHFDTATLSSKASNDRLSKFDL